jgi:hypothetical protein
MGKRIAMWLGIIFGIEIVLIALASILLSVFQADRFIAPTAALIVGIHFFPLARLFRVPVYYLTGANCLTLPRVSREFQRHRHGARRRPTNQYRPAARAMADNKRELIATNTLPAFDLAATSPLPPLRRRVETIKAIAIQAIMRCPFTRSSSGGPCCRSKCP